jgi:hypothetical protein
VQRPFSAKESVFLEKSQPSAIGKHLDSILNSENEKAEENLLFLLNQRPPLVSKSHKMGF